MGGDRVRAWCIVSVILATALRASAAEAPLPAATLTYVVGANDDTCPTEAFVRDEIRRRLGYDPFRDRANAEVDIVINKTKTGYVAHITTTENDAAAARRDIRSDQGGCAELVQSVILAVSLAIDPRSFAGPRHAAAQAAPLSDDEPEPPPPPLPSPPVVVPPPPIRARPWFVDANAALRVGIGVVPGPSLGPVIDVRVGRRLFAILVNAGVDLPTGSVTTEALRPARVRASLLWAGAGACFTPHRLFYFFVCGRIDAGALEGSGQGLAESHTATSAYAGVAALAGATYDITHGFQVGVRAELLAPFTRTTLNLEGTPVWSTPAVAGAFGVSLGYRH
jgi:hypothetical protein